MNIADLEKFLVIAQTENLQLASDELETSPSVLSKSLKRLECQLNTQLFDRVGKNIQINPSGELLRIKAAQLVSHAKQTQAEFLGLNSQQQYRIAGPTILQFRWASLLSRELVKNQPNTRVRFHSLYEQQALQSVLKGESDLALITTSIASQLPNNIHFCELDTIHMQVACSKNHELVQSRNCPEIETTLEELLQYPFASPNVSPYCGEARGIGCDGWQNQLYPRKLQLVVNDYSVLTQLVSSGQVLAYLPDYWLRERQLVHVKITDCPYLCSEKILLVSWQKELLNLFAKASKN